MKKPVFKRKEIIVGMPKDAGLSMATKECEAEVLYVGAQVEFYKPGDKILFQRTIGMEINYFDEKLWRIENEIQVICQIIEE